LGIHIGANVFRFPNAISAPPACRAEFATAKPPSAPSQSGAKAAAVQTLRVRPAFENRAERLDCGGSPPLFSRAPAMPQSKIRAL